MFLTAHGGRGAIVLLMLAAFSQSQWLGSAKGNATASPDERKNPKPAAWVLLIAEGKRQRILTQARTVKELFIAHNIPLNDYDRVEPALSTPVRNFLKVRITRVRVETITQQRTIPYQTEFRYSPVLRRGESKVVQAGEPGIAEREVKVWFKDGRVSLREPGETRIVKPPVNRVVMVGSRGLLASRGVRVRKVMTMIATGYSPDPRDNGKGPYGRTSTGLLAGYGTVAVDPRVIPYGTRLYVEGYGFAIAGDCGSAIKGNRIDLCYDSYERAQLVGRRKVKVFILE
ncbi:MAG: 3D domain-containing protein [Abditibacteriales bacterium]|nr:3D domain-containing protein [Abditibacteriales bacterium]MDW8367530.1 3D domain-containing protein [Abditibacteriales bacterium]